MKAEEQIVVAIKCLVFNHEPYLRQCLDGFVMQKTNFKFVAIVHDDCSTDGSKSIIQEYEAKYPEIIKPIYEKENQWSKHDSSLQKIMFDAIQATGCKYVALCEGDDYWTDPYKLQKQVDFMESHPEYIACFHNAKVGYDGHYTFFNSANENNYPTTEDIIKRKWFISTQSLLYRNIHLVFPQWTHQVINGDYILELLLAKEGRFYYMDDVMAVYRKHEGSASDGLNKNKIKMYDMLIYLLENMKNEYNGAYSDAFDESIANYRAQKEDFILSTHPIKKWLYRKTYTRAIKKLIRKII